MDVYWLGSPPEDLDLLQVDCLEDSNDNCLMFIEDPRDIAGKETGSRRIYLACSGHGPEDIPGEIMGVIPRDTSVIKAMTMLYIEMRHSFEIGDHLIRSISEKDLAIQEKQQQLIKDSKRHNAIIKHANDLIFILGPTGKIMFSNETLKQYLGEKEEHLSGSSFIDYVLKDDHASLTQMITKGFARGVPARSEVRLYLASGRTGIFSLLSTPLEENGRIYALSVIGRDITDLRAMQHRLGLQANDLSQMINGLSHELRNPLTVIGAYIRRLEREGEKKTRKWEQALSGIYSSIRRIEDMIARIERYEGIVKMDRSCVEIEVCDFVRQTISRLTLSVPVRVSAPPRIAAFCDPEHVRIAFTRIMENAVETGTPEIQVSISGSDGYAHVSIRDYGPGVRDDVKAIFAPFFSTDPMKTGLGLTEARIAMAKVGGDIQVVPWSDPGASFTIMVPLDRRMKSRH
jgi:PAS domain S-box-containing protein